MNLSDLLSFLERTGRRPNKQLSQNFLIDRNIVEKIIRIADLAPGDSVLEIGPGPGALTASLLEAGANVFAIEKDPILAHELGRLQTPDRRLTAICSDILDFDLSALRASAPLKVVANLPYHITTPILEKLLDSRGIFSAFTIMIQNEVAARIQAKSGSKEFSSLALFLQFHTQVAASFKVGGSCFYPRPQVDSKVLRLDLCPPPLTDSVPFFAIVRRAFQQRRKMIRSSLQSLYPAASLQNALYRAGAKVDSRPEELSLDQWLRFYKLIETGG